jgi:phosphohistidine phosphatase
VAGAWLAGRGVTPDAALVSSAARAVETWSCLAQAGGWEVEAETSEPLYGAGPEAALDLVRGSAAEARCLVVVGHNPTASYLSHLLDDRESEVEHDLDFPPSAAAVFEVPCTWDELAYGTCRLVDFYRPVSA